MIGRAGLVRTVLAAMGLSLVVWVGVLVDPTLLVQAAAESRTSLATGAGINAVLAAVALAVRGVSMSGALGGWLVGTLLYGFAGWRGFSLLALFFILGTACTWLGYATKAARGIAQQRGGRRGARHAFANGTVGVVFGVLTVVTWHPGAMLVGMAAAFATAAADTVASEIGQAYGKRHYLVTTLRRAPAGTDGAVSIPGTVAGIVAAVAVGGVAWGIQLIPPAAVGVVALAATFGMTLESVLGATIQSSLGLGNDLLNFSNTLAGGIAAAVLFSAVS